LVLLFPRKTLGVFLQACFLFHPGYLDQYSACLPFLSYPVLSCPILFYPVLSQHSHSLYVLVIFLVAGIRLC
jgi:hypothetical protein